MSFLSNKRPKAHTNKLTHMKNETSPNPQTINRSMSYDAVDEMIQQHLNDIRQHDRSSESSSDAKTSARGKAIGIVLVALGFLMPASAQTEIGWQGGTVYDFGEVRQHKGPVAHTFVFRNNGTAPFSVTDVRTSCDCTSAASAGRLIQPRDTAHVIVRFDPSRADGPFHQRIVVYTDSPARQNSLFIKGTVKPRKKQPSVI